MNYCILTVKIFNRSNLIHITDKISLIELQVYPLFTYNQTNNANIDIKANLNIHAIILGQLANSINTKLFINDFVIIRGFLCKDYLFANNSNNRKKELQIKILQIFKIYI